MALEVVVQEEADEGEGRIKAIEQMDDQTSALGDTQALQANQQHPPYHHLLVLAVEAALVVA